MHYGTDELNQIIDTPNGKALSLRMTFEDGTKITSFKKLRYSGGSNSSSDIAIGTTLSAYVDVSLFDEHNLTNQEFLLEQGAMLQDGTMEYVPIGYFTVQRPNSEDETVDFVAYDRMAKFIKPYVSELAYPTTSDKVLKEVCDMCGVELATTITNPIAIESKLDGYLCREVLGFISALHGSFACIDRFGKVNVRWYENEPISKELALVYALDKAQDDYVVEKIEVHKNAETSFTSGSGTRTMYNSNPYATQDSTNAIASKIGGFTYNPSKITMLDDIRLDPWDIVKVVNLDGNEVLIPCMQIEHDFTRGQTSIQSVGATETQTQYNYQGPTVEFMNRIATELLVVNRIVAKSVTTDYLEANYVSTKELDVVEANIKNAVIEDLSTEFADIHLANIDIADIGTFFADSGILDKVVIENGAVTGELKGVRIVGDVIEANTIKADSLILSGSEDSLIYQINVNSSGLSLEELSDEVYKEKLSGTDLVAKSVTTNELNVNEIFSNSAVVNKIFAQDITATGTITGAKLVGADAELTKGSIGGWTIENDKLVVKNSYNGIVDGIFTIKKPIATWADVITAEAYNYETATYNTVMRLSTEGLYAPGVRTDSIRGWNPYNPTAETPLKLQGEIELHTAWFTGDWFDYASKEVGFIRSFGDDLTINKYDSETDTYSTIINLKNDGSIEATGSISANSIATTAGADLDTVNTELATKLKVLGIYSATVTLSSTASLNRAAKTTITLDKSYPTASAFLINHSVNSDWVVVHPVGWANTAKSQVIVNYQNFYSASLSGSISVIVIGT